MWKNRGERRPRTRRKHLKCEICDVPIRVTHAQYTVTCDECNERCKQKLRDYLVWYLSRKNFQPPVPIAI